MKRKINKIIFLLSVISLFLSNNVYADNDIEHLISACDNGKASDCRELAINYIKQDDLLEDLENIETVLKLYHKACNAGDKIACFHLRNLYYGDRIVAENNMTLRELEKSMHKHSGLLGNIFNNLGYLYGRGKLFVPLNYHKAFELFKVVCKNNFGVGCYNLGLVYEYGKTVEKDYDKALSLYKKGCKLGYKKACSRAQTDTFIKRKESTDNVEK